MSVEQDKGSGCLILTYWCLPSVIVPFVQLLLANIWVLGAIINVWILISFGIAWARDTVKQPPHGPAPFLHRMWVRVIIFTLAQCVIIPVFLYTVVYGFCMITGTSNFH